MFLSDALSDYSFWTLILLSVFAFLAGFVDAVAGGGGLIQLPALLIQFPNTAIPTLFGTNKIAAFSGTSMAAVQYGRKIKFRLGFLMVLSWVAAASSFSGAKVVSLLNVALLKPMILVILILMLIYTWRRKELGQTSSSVKNNQKQWLYGILLSMLLGFYDGFFGPGTGSFFILGFVVLMGFEFLEASAYAKIINSVTNISALVVFISQGFYLPWIALIMAFSNVAGTLTGTRMALKKGNRFVRLIFLWVMILLILRYAFDVWKMIFEKV